MRQFVSIVVAIDFSPYSKLAARHAFDLARELKAMPVFIHVINHRNISAVRQALPKILGDAAGDFCIDDYVETIKNERISKLQQLIEGLNSEGLDYDVQVRIGIPYQELLKSIGEYEADLVVMGIKGNSDLPDAYSGMTALKMFRRCSVPLVTVRKYKP